MNVSLSNKLFRFMLNGNKIGKICSLIEKPFMKKYEKEYKKELQSAHVSCGVNPHSEKKIIVSLTSFKDRLPYIELTLKSLLVQTIKPNRIVLWYSCKREDFPDEILAYERMGIEFIHVDEDIKGHKKYYYAMKEFPDYIIVTVDDDTIYPKDFLEKLYDSYKEYPDEVSALRTHKITYDKNNKIKPYLKWRLDWNREYGPSNDLIAIGNGGILYPPFFMDKTKIDITDIKKQCLDADDIWLKYVEYKNNIMVVKARYDHYWIFDVAEAQKMSLSFQNVLNNKNDEYIRSLMEDTQHKT